MTGDPALQAFLLQQKSEYRAGLPQRLARLDAAWEGWCRAPDAAARHELERCAHALAGSAATFGLRELGEIARALEEACEQSLADLPRRAQALRDRLTQEIAST